MNRSNTSPRITHLLSNWRWTERSEPVTDLVLAERTEGADSLLVCGKSQRDFRTVEIEARAKGLEPVPLEMEKHLRLGSAARDLPRLRRLLDGHGAQVINCHMPNAHLLGALASRVRGRREALLVRSSYSATGPDSSLRARWLMKNATDGLVVISEQARQQAIRRYRFPASRIAVIEPGIDLDRFNTRLSRAEARARFGLGEDDFVVAMASRIQPRRRHDLLLQAAAALRERVPNLKLLLIGNGRTQDVLIEPARALGIEDLLVLPGYCEGEDLVAAYRAMDLLFYPVSGTDQSCRTLREALACGCPVLGGRQGYIPELVRDGFNGRLVELDADSLVRVIAELADDLPGLRQMSCQAAEDAAQRFRLSHQARQTLAFYQRLRAVRALPRPERRVSKRALALLGFYAWLAMSELELF